jgi:hypothetical protein
LERRAEAGEKPKQYIDTTMSIERKHSKYRKHVIFQLKFLAHDPVQIRTLPFLCHPDPWVLG